mmetsp:Transcript_9216/g.9183  ORF Transcript_9216/g.9183 Transcript_9216/m.9183 type:complete len:387 (-) Transcript_9216:20-1180(-)
MSKDEFIEMMSTRGFVNVDKFRYRHVWIMGKVYWKKETNFSIHNHLKYYTEQVKTQDELYKIFEENLTKDFPKELSPWQVLFVQEFREDKSAIILKSHHSLSDGLALVSLLLNLADPRPVTNTFINFSRGNTLKQFFFYAKSIIMSPLICYKVFSKKEPNTPIYGRPLTGKKSFACTDPLPLPFIKKFCEKEKISINTFILTIVSAAIQKYFEDCKEHHESIRACLPFSMRPLPRDGSILPAKNNVSLLLFRFPTDIKPEVNKYQLVNNLCGELKNSVEPFANNLSARFFGAFLPMSLVSHVVHSFGDRTSFNFSNVPGPTMALYAMEKKIHEMFFSAPCAGKTGLSLNCFSYNNTIVFGCTADRGVIPEARVLLNYMQEEVSKLS